MLTQNQVERMKIDGGVPLNNILSAKTPHCPSSEPYFDTMRNQETWMLSGVPERPRRNMVEDPQGVWGEALQRAQSRLGKGAIIALVGNRGTGKTQIGAHLVRHASLNPRHDLKRCGPPRYVRAMEFFLDIQATFRKESTQAARDVILQYVKPALLVIDEAHERAESTWENRLLTHMIDRRYADMADTVIISNELPAKFAANMGHSVMDRLKETGGIIECKWESFR